MLIYNLCILNTFCIYTDHESCTNSSLNPTKLRQAVMNYFNIELKKREAQQSIFPNITFTCNGFITKWIFGAEIAVSNYKMPELQIWRKKSEAKNKETVFQKINFSIPKIEFGSNSKNVVIDFDVSTLLEFQAGDIFGLYQPNGGKLAVYYQKDYGPVNYVSRNLDPPVPTKFSPVASNTDYDYPLVTVEIITATGV